MPIKSLKDYLLTDVILYDVTRLLTRRSSPFATGIDRVDLSFALGLAENSPERIVFVAQCGRDGAVVERDLMVRFMRSLQLSWSDSECWDRSFARQFERLGLVDNVEGPISSDLARLEAMTVGKRFDHLRALLSDSDERHAPSELLFRLKTRLPIVAPALALPMSVAPNFTNNVWRLWRDLRRRVKRLTGEGLIKRLERELEGRAATYFVCSHHGFARKPGFLRQLREAVRLDVVAYIHDIIPIQYPEYIRPHQVGQFERYLAEIAAAGGHFICNSADTTKRLGAHIAEQGWRTPIVATIRPKIEIETTPATNPSPEVLRLKGDTAPYFVTVGTIEPRKNHLLLLHLWRDFATLGMAPVPHLHIVGKRGWENENIVDLLERSPAIRRYVSEHDSLDDASLFHLMRGAKALLFPSFAEGLGLPLFEAAALGLPIIASDLPVFREAGLDGVTFLDPLDTPAWKQACLAVMGLAEGVAPTPELSDAP